MGTLSASFDLGSMIGSLFVGFTVKRISYGAGFTLAGVGVLLGLAVFVLTERRARGRSVLPRPAAEV